MKNGGTRSGTSSSQMSTDAQLNGMLRLYGWFRSLIWRIGWIRPPTPRSFHRQRNQQWRVLDERTTQALRDGDSGARARARRQMADLDGNTSSVSVASSRRVLPVDRGSGRARGDILSFVVMPRVGIRRSRFRPVYPRLFRVRSGSGIASGELRRGFAGCRAPASRRAAARTDAYFWTIVI